MRRKCMIGILCLSLGMLVACDSGKKTLTTEEQDEVIEPDESSDSEWTPDIY